MKWINRKVIKNIIENYTTYGYVRYAMCHRMTYNFAVKERASIAHRSDEEDALETEAVGH